MNSESQYSRFEEQKLYSEKNNFLLSTDLPIENCLNITRSTRKILEIFSHLLIYEEDTFFYRHVFWLFKISIFQSVQFSHSVMSDSLWPHESQQARSPCPSPTLGVHSDSSPLHQWCHPAISSSVAPFSSCPQSLPASESFPMSQLFTWGGQSNGVSALASFLPKKSQVWSPLEWTGWISLQSKGLSRVFSNTTVKSIILWCSAFSTDQLSHP